MIVTEFISLLIESLCLLGKVVYPLILVSTLRREHSSRVGKVRGSFAISQPSEGNITASGGGLGGVDTKSVKSTPLLCLNIREQRIRLGQLACFDGRLRFRL